MWLCFFFRCLPRSRANQTLGPRPPAWILVWSDEFNGPRLDTSKWVYDIGGGKWGNQELGITTIPQNVSLQDEKLVITARQEKHTGPDQASGTTHPAGSRLWEIHQTMAVSKRG